MNALETAHPKDRFTLDGTEAPAAAFALALGRGRLHHAWMLTGPEGLGKAAFAYRAARMLLGARPDARFGALGAAPDDPVSRMIAAQSHPDLLVLERSGEGTRKVIPVDEARRLPEFFAKAPAMGPYRIAIIDAVDDFNANGANAVLKTLEEPSGRGVLFLVSHAPGRLLPTLRSRCRSLAFRRWTGEALSRWLQEAAGVSGAQADALAAQGDGSPGRALAFLHADVTDLDGKVEKIVAEEISPSALMAMADGFRGAEGQARFALFVGRLGEAVRRKAQTEAPAAAARWSALWSRLADLPGRTEGLNLDRADAFWSAVSDIGATARSC